MNEDLIYDLAVEPRDYQLRIARSAIQLFEGGCAKQADEQAAVNSVLIESPTGSGKTIMGLMIARWLQRNHGFRIGWCAMRRNLLAQAAEENRRRGFRLEMELISMFDKHPAAVDLLVVDEAQHDAAESMVNLHATIQPAKTLGLSATPYRMDRCALCFERVLKDADIHHLIQSGHLSRYRHFTIPKYTPEAVADCYAREPERWGRSLIFFHRLEQCEQCHRLLRQRGIHGEVVTGQSDRPRQIEDFAAGRIPVLFSMMILAEGFDCPSLQTVFCRPSGRSCTVQMCGRVFRKYPEHPYKQIVQCRETRHPFPRSAAPAEQYVWSDSGWKSLKINRHLTAISNNAMRAIAQSTASLPKILTERRGRPGRWWRHRSSELGGGLAIASPNQRDENREPSC